MLLLYGFFIFLLILDAPLYSKEQNVSTELLWNEENMADFPPIKIKFDFGNLKIFRDNFHVSSIILYSS